jgi:hypothetical protein
MTFLKLIILFVAFSISSNIMAQTKMAKIDDTNFGQIEVIEVPTKSQLKSFKADQINGWPMAFESNASFKNMRGVCLSDIDNDGSDDIIFAANSKIFAYNSDGSLIWESILQGTATYPPAAADLNNDGSIEIVQITGGVPANGHIHVFDNEGNVMSGWPVSIDNNWLICSPALADLDNDKSLEILVSERLPEGRLHIFRHDGTNFSDNWPVVLDGYPAVTPSVAYDYSLKDNATSNALIDSLIVMCSTKSIYAFDIEGNVIEGFPIENDYTKFSYQSSLICNQFNKTDIIGASHGDQSEFYAFSNNGNYATGNWPVSTADNSWTYCPPIALGLNETFDFYIFGQPDASDGISFPTIHAFDPDGNYIDGFPYERTDGLEGFISAMYSADLSKLYIFTGSNMKDENGFGFIHAYSANTDLSDFAELAGFPIQVQGFTFMNGVNLGDVNNNNKLDLVVLSYDLDFADTDSIHINIFEMEDIIYNPAYCFGTYKGNNLRNGFTTPFGYNAKSEINNSQNTIEVYPRIFKENLNIVSDSNFDVMIFSSQGILIKKLCNCEKKCIFNLSDLTEGMYFVKVKQNNKISTCKVIKLK